jgi:hypothetical protein
MKFLRLSNSKKETAPPLLLFQITPREKAALLAVLQLFPVLDASHHQFTNPPQPARAAEQRLLQESMSQLQDAHQRKLDQLFRGEEQFFPVSRGELRMALTAAQLEWLLQILNDIRVGSWVRLGCPDLADGAHLKLSGSNAHALYAMHVCGEFQSIFLEAVT